MIPGEVPTSSLGCSVCGDHLGPDGVACEICATPHHADCWEYTGGCSLYGCGGLESRPVSEMLDAEGQLVLAEARGAALPSVPGRAWLAIRRRVGAAAPYWPRTVGYGFLGIAIGSACCTLLGLMGGGPGMYLTMVGAGALHGLLVPFFAPLQHRRPGGVALVAWVLHALLLVAFQVPGRSGFLDVLLGVSSLLTWMVATTSASDALMGPRSRAGQWLRPHLGRGMGVVRLLATVGTATLAFLIPLLFMGGVSLGNLDFQLLGDLSLLGTMVALAASPALEVGKQAYLERLPPARRGLPES